MSVTFRRLFVALLGTSIVAQTAADHQAVIANLGREADLFERSAYRFAGTETLRQTVPSGVRVASNARGIETRLPGFTREIVSDYGFVSLDEPGGSIREVRHVRKVDGQTWNRNTRSLAALAQEIANLDDKGRKRQLESYEDFGLHGFVSDLGQLVLLFARGGTARYEIRFERSDDAGMWVYTYQQLDGREAFTVYGESEQPSRQKLKGRIWVRPDGRLPTRISIDADRVTGGVPMRDTSTVDYARSPLGCLLPVRIVHQQYVETTLYVTDEFTYANFREVLPKGKR